MPTQAADEIARRTPGFTGWQQEQWLSCCGDACEYYGDAPETEVRSLSAEDVMRIATETGYPADFVASFVRTYEVGGNPCLHKFVCRHCRAAHYAIDGT